MATSGPGTFSTSSFYGSRARAQRDRPHVPLIEPNFRDSGSVHLCLVKCRNCFNAFHARGGGGVLPYLGYIGMCGPKGYGFSAVFVINRVSILASFGHFGHKWGMVFAL